MIHSFLAQNCLGMDGWFVGAYGEVRGYSRRGGRKWVWRWGGVIKNHFFKSPNFKSCPNFKKMGLVMRGCGQGGGGGGVLKIFKKMS